MTCVSIPVYALLFHRVGVEGLAIASDLGIVVHTLALAGLLHRYRLVSVASLEYAELAKAALAAVVTYAGASAAVRYVPHPAGLAGDVLLLATGSVVWMALGYGTLAVSGSRLAPANSSPKLTAGRKCSSAAEAGRRVQRLRHG